MLRFAGARSVASIFLAATVVVAGCSAGASPSASTASPSAQPTASVAPSPSASAPIAGAPAAPTKLTWKLVKQRRVDTAHVTDEYRATWKQAAGPVTKFEIFGVTACIREAADTNDTPCVTNGTEIPKTALKLLATAKGSKRSVTFQFKYENYADALNGVPYQAFVIRAANAAGTSPFAVFISEPVCWQCVY